MAFSGKVQRGGGLRWMFHFIGNGELLKGFKQKNKSVILES